MAGIAARSSLGNAGRSALRRLALLAALVLVALALVSGVASAATLTGGNGIYRVHVLNSPGTFGSTSGVYTITTDVGHPLGAGKNLLFGNGTPRTSFNTIHSYTTNTDYTQNSSATSATGGAVVSLESVPHTTEPIPGGFRSTYSTSSPDKLTIVQDVIVVGSSIADSRVSVSTAVVNNNTDPVNIGIRYVWDYQIGGDDGPTFQALNPDGPVLKNETDFAPPTFETYRITDNDTNAGAPTYSVVATANGPSVLDPEPTPPDLLQAACWDSARRVAFFPSASSGANFADMGAGGCANGGADMAVVYGWGPTTLPASGGFTVVSASPVATSPSGTFPSAGMTSPPGTGPDPGPGPGPPGANPQPGGKRPVGVNVSCNRGPQPTDDSRCRVTVGDAGAPPQSVPTGTVTFTAAKGGFRGPNGCALQRSLPTASACEITYAAPPEGIAAGTQYPLLASYSGSAVHKSATGGPKVTVAVGRTILLQLIAEACSRSTAGLRPTAARNGAFPRMNAVDLETRPDDGFLTYCLAKPLAKTGRFVFGVFRAGELLAGSTSEFLGNERVAGTITVASMGTGGVALGVPGGQGLGGVLIIGGAFAYPVLRLQGGVGTMLRQDAERAFRDPPRSDFRVLGRPARPPRIRVRGAKSAERALRAQQRLIALGRALSLALDRAGGAQRARQPRWEGAQMRLARTYSRQLADAADGLARLLAAAAPEAARVPASARQTNPSQLAAAQRALRRKGFPRAVRTLLLSLGYDAKSLARLKRAALRAKPSRAPARYDLELGDVRLRGMLIAYAAGFRVFAELPEVKARARLR